ncbi:hypothetical protein Ahy_A05g023049 isoform B [Arachis hypogaea]|uniref:AT-rich interactive domain-containing protein n=1 Tax=Arachis hypogaea TaxID=3818 RepID=A0A445D2D2_ARAHY|nr:hypothetical protein Ahy_A05g023049 isoform B [Arachis hypogaea]
MAFTVATSISGSGGARILCNTSIPHRPHLTFRITPSATATKRCRGSLHVVSATKKFSPRSGKGRRGSTTTKDQDQDPQPTGEIEDSAVDDVDDGYFLPDLPGEEKDFWEGTQWDWLGFFVEYMWAFGVVFALIACGIAVATYNEGATDFKETPAYKESVQSRELLEGPEASDSDIFESNPTEVAPSLN